MTLYFYVSNVFDDYIDAQYKPVLGSEINRAFDDIHPVDGRVLKHISEIQLLDLLRTEWQRGGWEGDGTIEYAMLPPYAFNDYEDGRWRPVFHVKQENNGTSFVASSEPMLSKNLRRI